MSTDLKLLGPLGHWRKEEPQHHHWLGWCDECDVHILRTMTVEKVEHWWGQGVIGQDTYEAFMHVWTTTCYREPCWDGWKQPLLTKRSKPIAELLTELLTETL